MPDSPRSRASDPPAANDSDAKNIPSRFPLHTSIPICGRDKTRVVQLLLGAAGLLCIGMGLAVHEWGPARRILLHGISLWKGTDPTPEWTAKVLGMSVEILISGAFLLASALLVPVGGRVVGALAVRRRLVVLASGVALLVTWLPVVLFSRSTVIGGERTWWLFDDGMISMRYARNLASGAGLVWNPGERVEGYSNFLWTLWMALVHLFPIPETTTSLVVMLTNVALGLATLPVLGRLVRILGGETMATVVTLAGFILSRDVITWATGGLETTLLTFLTLLAVYRILQEAEQDRARPGTYFLIASLCLVRVDGLVLCGLLMLASVFLSADRRNVVAYSALSLLLPLAHEAFRIMYYGDFLSNTAYLKTAHWSGRTVAGLRHSFLFGLQYAIPIAFALLGLRSPRGRSRRGVLLGLMACYAAYVAYVGGDAFQNYRFFVPILPVLFLLALCAIEESRLEEGARLALGAVCVLPLIVPNYPLALLKNTYDEGNVKIGLLLKQNTAPGCRVADAYAGSVFYFSGRYGIDLLGKSDRHIAREVVAGEGRRAGHNKFDYDYSIGRLRPDIVIAMFRLPEDLKWMEQYTRGDTPFRGRLYFHPVFHEHCLPYPVNVDTPRSIFVCDWSSELPNRLRWKGFPLFNELATNSRPHPTADRHRP